MKNKKIEKKYCGKKRKESSFTQINYFFCQSCDILKKDKIQILHIRDSEYIGLE